MPELMLDLYQIAGIEPPDPGIRFDKHKAELDTVGRWIGDGAAPALIRQVLTKRCATLRTSPRSLAFFDEPVRQAISTRSAELSDTERQALAILQRTDQARRPPTKGLHS
jgi:hypothetical protein